MNNNTRIRRKLTALVLILTLLLGGALPAVWAGAAEDAALAVRTAYAAQGAAPEFDAQDEALEELRALAALDEPYVLPPGAEAAGAVWVPLALLQSGSLDARWPAPGGLQSQGSAAEDAFVGGLQGYKPSVSMKAFGLTEQQAVDLMQNTINTRPELFYFYGIYMSFDNNKVDTVWFVYTAAISVVKAQVALLNAEVNYILSLVPSGLTPMEKVLWVNEYLAMTVYYPDVSGTWENYWFNVYGILVNGVGVCQGYALANCLLLGQKLGVSCAFITSDPMDHAWNMVQLDGQWYHVDTTWNDLSIPGHTSHDYLLLSDSVIKDSSHQHYSWEGAPAQATSTKYNSYFWLKTSSAVVWLGGKWYYCENNDSGWAVSGTTYQNAYALRTWDAAANSTASFMTITQKVSPVPASTTKFKGYRYAPSLAALDNKLYLNDGREIGYIVPATMSAFTAVKTENLNESNYQSICGFAIWHGQIKYGVIDASGGGTATLHMNRSGPILADPPSLPSVPKFEVNADGVSLRYGASFTITSTPRATRYELDAGGDKYITLGSNGKVTNKAWNEEGVTGVWVYGPDGQYAYVIVEYYTVWWQWLIWIFLLGFIWY